MSQWKDLYNDKARGYVERHRVHVASTFHEYDELKNMQEKYPYLKDDKEFQDRLQTLKDDLEGHGTPALAEKMKSNPLSHPTPPYSSEQPDTKVMKKLKGR